MRNFYFDPDGDDYEDMDDPEMEMEVEGQFIMLPDEFVVQQDNSLTVNLELKKLLLFASMDLLEKSKWNPKTLKKNREMFKETFKMLEDIIKLEQPDEDKNKQE